MEARSEITHQPGTEARGDKQREDLGQDHAEGLPESRSRLGMDDRDHKRHQQCGQKIYEHYVCSQSGHISSQFPGHDCRGCSRRADQAKHGAFQKDDSVVR